MEPTQTSPEQQNINIAEELARIPYEPLLPAEKKLIIWSLSLGVVLLVILAWISSVFFAAS
jgi:hypothetical protein